MGWLVETVLVCVLVLVFLTLVVLGLLVETVFSQLGSSISCLIFSYASDWVVTSGMIG